MTRDTIRVDGSLRCMILGHSWDRKYPINISEYKYTCGRCGLQVFDMMQPDRRPWLTGYPLKVERDS